MTTWTTVKIAEVTCPFCNTVNPVKTVAQTELKCGACNEKRKFNIVSKLWMCPACGGWEGNETTTL